MNKVQAMKWVNALREDDIFEDYALFLCWQITYGLNHDEIADVIQLIYVEGALK